MTKGTHSYYPLDAVKSSFLCNSLREIARTRQAPNLNHWATPERYLMVHFSAQKTTIVSVLINILMHLTDYVLQSSINLTLII